MASIESGNLFATRPAEFTLPFDRPSKGLKKGVAYRCNVFGCFQVIEGPDSACPYFIVELEDGTCAYIDPAYLRFVDRGVTRE